MVFFTEPETKNGVANRNELNPLISSLLIVGWK